MNPRKLPDATKLTRAQYSGWACCWCSSSLLRSGGISAGVARGSSGAHVLDIEVYACAACAAATTDSRPPLQETRGAMPSTPGATANTRRNP
ncbi:hypothetical protein SAMN05216532_4031 [Streptomyces sp. 2231.1]|uniref:hypothetical protein n=1 Tax=Streptomyces sp. 2231.1 TaxID=1855347 RepID=UPI00089C75CF|nr:hypothetical protein [Streptomyces sp. 2231.1]SED27486.1 hypothetical protein SAMN05216532_4031 [Streptomyces sp. 2231.1]